MFETYYEMRIFEVTRINKILLKVEINIRCELDDSRLKLINCSDTFDIQIVLACSYSLTNLKSCKIK